MGYWLLYWLGRQCLEGRLWQSALPLGQRRRTKMALPQRELFTIKRAIFKCHPEFWTTPESCGKGAIQLSSKDVAVKAGGTSHTHHHIIYKLLCNLMCIINNIKYIHVHRGG